MTMRSDEPQSPPVEVPMEVLSTRALEGVIEAFVLREGTDYGITEVPIEKKRSQVMDQLKKGQIKIVFDPSTESVTLMTLKDWLSIAKKFDT